MERLSQEPPSQPDPREQERLDIGRHILDRIRADANGEFGYFGSGEPDEDVFRALYLTERETAVPEQFVSDDLLHELSMDVRAMYGQVFNGLREELWERMGRQESFWVVIDPAVDDHTLTVFCTDRSVLLFNGTKPWNFRWDSEDAMVADLGSWYEVAAAGLLAERRGGPSDDAPRAGVWGLMSPDVSPEATQGG